MGDNGAIAAGRGGALTAGVDDASAIYFNQALATLDGFSVTLNANLWLYDIGFARAPLDVELIPGQTTTYTFEPVENENKLFPARCFFSPMISDSKTGDLGSGIWTAWDWGNPVSLCKPRRASQTLRTDTTTRDWGHSYLLTEADVLLAYPSLAVAHDFIPFSSESPSSWRTSMPV